MTLALVPATPADREQVFAWMTAPGIVEHMMGPPDFPDSEVPDYEEFCADWAEHYWTGTEPARGRVMLLVDGDRRVGMFAHNDIVITPEYRLACEVDVWLQSASVLGRNYGPAGLALLCQRLRAELDVGQVFLQPSARNTRALRAYEKAGFIRWPQAPDVAARWFSTQPDYADSVFLVRELPPASSPQAHVEVLPDDFDRTRLDPLLSLADDSATQIASYRDRGAVYALVLDGSAARPDAVAGLVLVTADGETPELENMAVREDLQGRGLGAFLVRTVLCWLAANGATCVRVATATAGTETLRWYQRLGFRFSSIERDWFTPARGYPPDLYSNGVLVRDRIWLDRALPT